MTVTEEGVKKLGFGLMRLPQKDGAIDIGQTKTMVDMFLNAGFNYFDTASATKLRAATASPSSSWSRLRAECSRPRPRRWKAC